MYLKERGKRKRRARIRIKFKLASERDLIIVIPRECSLVVGRRFQVS